MRDSIIKYCYKIISLSELKISKVIEMLGISRSKFYGWNKRLNLPNNHNGKQPKQHWLTPVEKQTIIDFAKSYINKNSYYLRDGYRRLSYTMLDENVCAASPSSVYRVLKNTGLLNRWKGKRSSSKGKGYKQPIQAHSEWHTDIKYINFKGSFLFFISVMDGYSRYIVHHELRISMNEFDVELVIQKALEKYPDKKPKLISDNGSQYKSKEFQLYLKEVGLQHIRTSPAYPQSNGKIERFHRSLDEECVRTTSMINLEDAKEQISKYVDHYNNKRLHSSLYYLRPVDFLNGNIDELLKARQTKLDKAADNRIMYWKAKNNLENTMKSCNLELSGEAETGNAGERPARNSPANVNN